MQKRILLILSLFSFGSLFSQTIITGRAIDAVTNEPIPSAQAHIEVNDAFADETNANGEFEISGEGLPLGEQILVVTKNGYRTKRLPIVIKEGETLDLKDIGLEIDVAELQIATITLSDQELTQEVGGADNISGLLSASKDVFLEAAAYDFSATFFNPRGLGSENGKVLINGIVMNQIYNGRPEWSLWGGLNDAQRNRVFSMGLSPNETNFGGLAGTTNIVMRASQYREGGKVSYAAANRSYTGRVTASYNSGLLASGWAYSVLFARRFGEEGFRDGTLYDANSFFASVEKKLGEDHSLNLSAFFVPYRRGKASANTQEVYDLKSTKYNSYWGYQNGEIRNSRVERIEQPVIMLNHYWDISESTRLNTNLAYQFGEYGNSRLGYDNAQNPDPAYYRKLPSFALAQDTPDLAQAYENYSSFTEYGQIKWEELYAKNINDDGPAHYYLYEDRSDAKKISANMIVNSQLSPNIKLTGAVRYRDLEQENFAYMIDLLGDQNYLDVDSYTFGSESPEAQSDLQNPNRLVQEGDRFKYNYIFDATVYSGFAQGQFKTKNIDFYLAGNVERTTYLRTGLYQNGHFPDNSLGESEELEFTTYGAKAGATFKITGRHLIDLNAGYLTKAPSLRNSFSNSRQNNQTVVGLEEQKIQTVDLSYIYRGKKIEARLTGYYSKIMDATEISFYYADGVSFGAGTDFGRTSTRAFIQEVLTNIDKRHLGLEFGIEGKVTQTLTLKAAAALGQFVYDNNPSLYIASDDFSDDPDGRIEFGKSYLENYHLAGGPEQAYQIGFEYRDPDYWFFGATTNYFSNAYIDVSPITRTKNFYLDTDGIPFNDYNPEIARELLKQEQFNDYFLVNFIGGKSWKIDDYYIGVFGVISNVLDETYKTGGYEQGRAANYRELLEDTSNKKRIFGPKYWYGYGTTFYLNVYFRF